MTTQTADQTIAKERADIWRAAAALTREHRAGGISLVGDESAVAKALWHLAKSFDERADAVWKRGTCSTCRFERPGRISQHCANEASLARMMRTTDVRTTWGCTEYKPQPTATEEASK